MAGSVNKVILIGNLGKDPEIRNLQNGSKVANLTLATSEAWTDRASGERKEKTEWHRVVIFDDRLCDVAEKYLKKGRKVYVEGALQTRKWTDQTGQDKYTTEIVLNKFRSELTMLDSQNASGEGGYEGGGARMPAAAPAPRGGGSGWEAPPQGKSGGSDLDDEIPF